MEWNDYVTNAVRTKSDKFNIAMSIDVIHAIIGLSTEAGELLEAVEKAYDEAAPLDVVNVREEMGDLLWYIAIYCNAVAEPPRLRGGHIEDKPFAAETVVKIAIATANLLDMLKKHLFYVKAFDWNTANGLVSHIYRLISYYVDIPAACEVNIAKLRKRFPDRFTTENANTRDLAAERKILEAGVSLGILPPDATIDALNKVKNSC